MPSFPPLLLLFPFPTSLRFGPGLSTAICLLLFRLLLFIYCYSPTATYSSAAISSTAILATLGSSEPVLSTKYFDFKVRLKVL